MLHINAKDARLGIILNVIALAVIAIVTVLAVIPMDLFNDAVPLTVFTLIFIPLTVVLFFLDRVYYLISAAIFGMHLGGCSGDMYVIYLFMTKFKSKRALTRDTGPEQFFYLPEEN